MPLSTFDHKRLRNSRKKQDLNTSSQRNYYKHSVLNFHFSNMSTKNGSRESKSSLSRRPQKKKTFMSLTLEKLGCKGDHVDPYKPMKKNMVRRKKTRLSSVKNQAHVVVDTHDVCCAPPGIGSISDVVPRPKITSQISKNKEHLHVPRRTANAEKISALRVSNTRINHHPPSHSCCPIMIFIQNFQFARELDGYDQYRGWRFDVDAMSYEQPVKLTDRIGYVGTSLGEEQILQHAKKLKHSTISSPLLISKSWRCTICQERYKGGDEIGRLDCGHYHHIECIKQWLLQKNACPLCKSAVAHDNGE